MFPKCKCIIIHSIILIHVATSAFGKMVLRGSSLNKWIPEGDEKIARVNELLKGACKSVSQDILAHFFGLQLDMSIEAVSMVYLSSELEQDNDPRIAIVVVQSSIGKDVDLKRKFKEMIFDYLNLDGYVVKEKHRLHLATAQNVGVSLTLEEAKRRAEKFVNETGDIKMYSSFGLLLPKMFDKIKGFFGQSAPSTSGEASSIGAIETKNNASPQQ